MNGTGAGGGASETNPPPRLPRREGPPGVCGQRGRDGEEELGPYLVGSGRIGAGVSPEGRELLLQAVVGAVAEAVGDPRRRQDPGDAGEGEEGEEKEFRGLCLFPAPREWRDVAFLQRRRERQRLSCAVTEQRGGGSRRGEHPAALTFGPRGGRQTEGQGQERAVPRSALSAPAARTKLPRGGGAGCAQAPRSAPRLRAPLAPQREPGAAKAQQGKIRYCFFLREK